MWEVVVLVDHDPAESKVPLDGMLDLEGGCHIFNSNWVLTGTWGCNKSWYRSSHFWNAASATASSGCSHAISQSSSGDDEVGFDLLGVFLKPARDVAPSAPFVSGKVFRPP